VPFALDLIKDGIKREMMEVASAPLAMGRPIAAPPNVPLERVNALRQALADTFRDPEYLAECVKLRLACSEPVTAQAITDGLARAYRASPEVIAALRQHYRSGESK